MTMGAQQAEQWRDADSEPAALEPVQPVAQAIAYTEDYSIEEPPPLPVFWREIVPAVILALAGLGWIAGSGWIVATRSPVAPDALGLIGWVALASGPLALIAILYLLLQRTSRREARRFARSARAMGAQAVYLERVLANLSARIDEQRAALAAHTEELVTRSDQAATRLNEISGTIGEETSLLAQSSTRLSSAASAARGDMSTLMAALPRAEEQTREMTALLQDASKGAQQQAMILAGQLAQVAAHGRKADEAADSAARNLADYLTKVEESGAAAEQRMRETGAEMAALVEQALKQATDAIDVTRKAMEAQSAGMLAMIDQSRAALDRAGSDSARALGQRLDEVGGKVEELASRLAAQDAASFALVGNLDKALAEIEQRFAALGDTGTERTADLAEAIVALSTHIEQISASLTGGGDAADALIQRAAMLRSSLDVANREMAETLPAALARVADTIAIAAPGAAKLEASARAVRELLDKGDEDFARQRDSIEELGHAAQQRVAAVRDQAETLHALIVESDENSRRLAEGAGPQLVEALLRVRDTAIQAADHARETLAGVIPGAAEAMGAATGEAIDRVLAERVEKQMAGVAAAAEQAVRTAADASEQLSRRLLTISGTAAAAEERIESARIEAENEAAFSHRAALLIESLNSTAIDVTKILSNEVTDSAWAAYLRGDRGIFTRRAVRLISTGEAREIARHYQDEPEFREHVNRYIHDFEAMLRRILATRDSSPLSVTMLSSDMGKLYVALAQAIERLRQ